MAVGLTDCRGTFRADWLKCWPRFSFTAVKARLPVDMSALILLVEDDAALLSTLQAAMTYGGFESETVATGKEAIERFQTRRFDAVLIDLGLPDVDGGQVLETLRKMSDVPLLV